MKVIPANVHKGTADHKKHTEAFAKKKKKPLPPSGLSMVLLWIRYQRLHRL